MIMLVKPPSRNWRSSIRAIIISAFRIPGGLRNGKIPSITNISASATRMLCHIVYMPKGRLSAVSHQVSRHEITERICLYSFLTVCFFVHRFYCDVKQLAGDYLKYLKNSVSG